MLSHVFCDDDDEKSKLYKILYHTEKSLEYMLVSLCEVKLKVKY